MSTKLKELIKKDRQIYENEKEKFLNDLAEFLANRTPGSDVCYPGYYHFAMQVSEYKGGSKVVFSWNTTDWLEFRMKELDKPIFTKLPPETIYTVLQTEYKATVSPYKDDIYKDYVKVKLYFD